ncbi:hypothetical protein H7827_12715 [Streptomyces sp. JH002]|uniref:Integral membrane protein n=1 Tax=Streptomyces xiamenensis TaxID=408015 RepID=A0A0F7FVA9_9ACTN|nr:MULTISPECIES: hypothetical protein [Streptomyces]AKG44439.1 integral membrane protein [Streptomyces xiamenensis]MCU4747530.1 hypothetical protein [Streptomyces sp. G-5]QQN78149.1 hypothetical protein IPZ77_12320 [Streptomyces sp. XC 2026]
MHEASQNDQVRHEVTLNERGPFVAPRCSCGWYGPARRSRPLARDEAAAHTATARSA